MGRWKGDGKGGSYYDPNDSGPDQVAPPVSGAQVQPQSIMAGELNPQAPPAASPNAAPWSSAQREQFKNQWMGTGTNVSAQNALLAQHGLTPDSAGRVRLPTGELLDLRIGAKAGINQAAWTGVAGQGAKIGQASGSGSGSSGASANASGSGGGGGGNSFQQQIRKILLGQLQGLSAPVTANDPAIAGEMQAQERILERLREQRRAEAAERMAFEGLNAGGAGSGAFDQEIASGFEDKGQALTGLQAQLFSRELQSRRGSLASLLNMALQTGDAESARALQLQLAQMDNELRRLGLSQQASQFNDQFGLQRSQFEYDMNRDASRAAAGLPF